MTTERNRQLIADLASEWGTIRLLLDGEDLAIQAQLDELRHELAASVDPADIDDLILDLLDLLEETPAAEYVRTVVGRSSDLDDAKLKSPGGSPVDIETVERPSDRATARELAASMGLELRPHRMKLHFGTNRGGGENEFNVSVGDRLRFGSITLTIPVIAQVAGEADVPPRRAWWKPGDAPDAERHITSAKPCEMENAEDLLGSLARTGEDSESNEILVAVHGYNVRFDEAARSAAQFSFNTRFRGQTTFFAWPSEGKVRSYTKDEDRAESAAGAFIEFLKLVQRQHPKVHVLAHSMGNRVVVNALVRKIIPADRLGTVAWVAPDVSQHIFADAFPQFRSDAESHTLYASSRDRALLVSSALKTPRIGRIDDDGVPFTTPGLETVNTSNVSSGILGHSPHVEARAVMTDLEMLLNEGATADNRAGLRPAPIGNWWFLP